jgi:hypothetical protein
MARPRIFISSTFYDLKQIRAELDMFIESLGYEPIRNEEGDIPYGKDEALEEYCYKEIKNVDILVSIIGGRFGSTSKKNELSISQLELSTALKEGKQVYIFIEKNVLAEYETYLLNKNKEDITYKYIDNIKIYKFIEEIKSLSANNNIKGFEMASDINKYLKEQFAGLFQRFLGEQIRLKEISLITSLEKTSETLNKLVNFLSLENKGKTEEVNKILNINHPLIGELRNLLNIPYNFYIEGIVDLEALIKARGFEKVKTKFNDDFLEWQREVFQKVSILKISKKIFDKDGKLKFFKATDWNKKNISFIEKDKDDDLPF